MAPLLKIFAWPLSAVCQHFSNHESMFRSKVAVKDSQECDSIILNHSFTQGWEKSIVIDIRYRCSLLFVH